MIKLTEFTSVVDTYKKNFDIRSKRFSDKKKKDTAEKIKKREDRIEPKKFLGGSRDAAGNVANKMKPGGDILDTAIRFAGFTLLGVIVKNLDKIAVFAKQVIEKVKELAIRFKKYFDDVIVPIFNDIVGLGTQIKDTFGDIANFVIRMNPYNELSDVLETVMSGILVLGYRLASLYRPFVKPTTPGATPPATKAKKTPVKTPARTPVKTPAPVSTPAKKPAKIFSRTPVRSPSVLSPTQSRNILKSLSRSLSRTLTGTPVGAGVGASGSSSTGIPLTPAQIQANILDKEAREALDRTFKALDANKKGVELPVAPPGQQTALEEYMRNVQDKARAVDPALTKAAGESARVRYKGGDELIGGEKPPSQRVARARLKGDLLRQGVPMSTGFEDLLRSIQTTKPSRFSLENITGTFKSGFDKLKGLDFRFDISGFDKLTKGLDFRFDIGKVIKEQLLNPKNFLKNLGSFAVGMGIDVGAKFIGKYISSILPYNEDFELFGYLGMIDPDRIHQLTAGKIINLPEERRKKAIERLERDSKSSDDIFGTGQKKREMANAILKYISIFSGGEITPDVKPKVPAVVSPKQTPNIIPNPNKRADEDNYDSGGNKIRIGDTVGGDISRGLNSSTTYDNQGRFTSREVYYLVQPVEIG